jgi:hypothetical protein
LLPLTRGHLSSGIVFAIGAAALPLLGALLGSERVIRAAGVIVSAGLAFFLAWHLLRFRPAAVAALKAEVGGRTIPLARR